MQKLILLALLSILSVGALTKMAYAKRCYEQSLCPQKFKESSVVFLGKALKTEYGSTHKGEFIGPGIKTVWHDFGACHVIRNAYSDFHVEKIYKGHLRGRAPFKSEAKEEPVFSQPPGMHRDARLQTVIRVHYHSCDEEGPYNEAEYTSFLVYAYERDGKLFSDAHAISCEENFCNQLKYLGYDVGRLNALIDGVDLLIDQHPTLYSFHKKKIEILEEYGDYLRVIEAVEAARKIAPQEDQDYLNVMKQWAEEGLRLQDNKSGSNAASVRKILRVDVK